MRIVFKVLGRVFNFKQRDKKQTFVPQDLFKCFSISAATKEDMYETNGTVAKACFPSMSVSSMYNGK